MKLRNEVPINGPPMVPRGLMVNGLDLESKPASHVTWSAIGFALTCILLGVVLATGLTASGGSF